VYAPSLFVGYGITLTERYHFGAEINWSNEGSKFEETLTNNNFRLGTWSNKIKTTKTLGIKLGYLLRKFTTSRDPTVLYF